MDVQAKRVLVIDDDRFMRRATEATLRKQGFTVIVAIDGEEGLDLANKETPDLILLDVIMPKLNGFEVLRRLKENAATANIPVAIMTALGQDGDIAEGLKGGACDYLIKTGISFKLLGDKVRQLLNHKAEVQ